MAVVLQEASPGFSATPGPKEHEQRLALVTGAGHRVGRGIALALAAKGYAIGLHYHQSVENARHTAEEIQATGAPVLLLPADLTDEQQVVSMFAQVRQAEGMRLSVLVNSAGIMPRGDLREMSAAEWDQVQAINLRAPFLCAREAAKLMGAWGGAIINITDSGANRPWTGYPAYVVSKSALETLTRVLAKSLAPAIRVNAVAPGLILPSPEVSEEQWQRLVGRLPLRQPGTVEAVVKAIFFLLENEYVTGQTIVVDGGYQLV